MNHEVSFRGTGKEYLSIWIVNTLLTMITLNVYSAWAKVRKRRYFAEKLFIDDEPFEYLANPMALFRGWLVAAAAFVIYMIARHLSPIWGAGAMFVIAAFVPWVVVKSRVFNARNRAFRNIRFSFAPKYAEAYRVMLGWSLLSLIVFPLWPYAIYRQKKFFVENSSYGTTPFRFKATPGEFYKIFVFASLWMLGALVIAVIIVGIVVIVSFKADLFLPRRVLGIAAMLIFISAYLLVIVYYKTSVTNLVWNRTELGGMRFHSSMKTLRVAWLYLSGGVAVICSFGFLFPWATVRLMRYRCEQLAIRSQEGIERFIADTASVSTGAVGEEIGDMFDMGFDIGF